MPRTIRFPLSGRARDFHPLDYAHVGRTKEGPADNPVDGGHHLEATLAYNFGDKLPLTLAWSTWLAGTDIRTDAGKRSYSTYLNASYDIACPAEFMLTPSIGFTPWKGYYNEKAAITDFSLGFEVHGHIQALLHAPFVQLIASPMSDHVYLVAGGRIRL